MIAILAWFTILTIMNFGGITVIIMKFYLTRTNSNPALMEYINKAEGYDGSRK